MTRIVLIIADKIIFLKRNLEQNNNLKKTLFVKYYPRKSVLSASSAFQFPFFEINLPELL